MNNTVIACVDGSPSTRPVCEYAAWAAGKLGARWRCCTCSKRVRLPPCLT
nr:universal stress protein [Pluralibacter gergoviae]